MRDRRGDEAQLLGPFPARELLEQHRQRGAVAVHHALGAPGGAGVGDAVDVLRAGRRWAARRRPAQRWRRPGPRPHRTGPGRAHGAAAGLLARPRLQRLAALGKARIDHQRGNAGVLQHKGLVIQRAQRVQRGLAQAQPGAGDQHHQASGRLPVSTASPSWCCSPSARRPRAMHAARAAAARHSPVPAVGQHQGHALGEGLEGLAIGLGHGGAGVQCGRTQPRRIRPPGTA